MSKQCGTVACQACLLGQKRYQEGEGLASEAVQMVPCCLQQLQDKVGERHSKAVCDGLESPAEVILADMTQRQLAERVWQASCHGRLWACCFHRFGSGVLVLAVYSFPQTM